MFPQRATAGLRRTTPELTDGNHDDGTSSEDNNPASGEHPTAEQTAEPGSMEVSSSPPLTELERDNLLSWHGQDAEELHYPEVLGLQEPIRDGEEVGEDAERGKTDGDECDYLVFEIGAGRGREEPEESEGGQNEEKAAEEGGSGETGDDLSRGGKKVEERGKVVGEDGSIGEPESEPWMRGETEGQGEGEDEGIDEMEREDGGGGDGRDEDGWRGKMEGEDELADLLFISGNPVCPSSSDLLPVTEPSAWGHDPGNSRDDLSDGHLSDGHLSDCLQAELAVVYSDSDAGEEQWAAFAPFDVSSRDDGGTQDGKDEERGGEEEEEEVERGVEVEDKVETESGREEQRGEEGEEEEQKRGGRGDEEEQMRSRRDQFLRSPSVSSTASSTDPDRKVRLETTFQSSFCSVCTITSLCVF